MNAKTTNRRPLFIGLALLALLLGSTVRATPASFAMYVVSASGVNIMPPGPAQPLGKSYGEWNAAWWQWALSQPAAVNPVLDGPDATCAQGQPADGPVWFLAGKLDGGAAYRTCTVPLGRALYIPVANAFGAEPVGTAQDILDADKAAAIASIDTLCGTALDIDGQRVGSLEAYRAPTDWFLSQMPADNYWGAPAGEYKTFADGYGVIVKPLSPGAHTVHIYACFQGPWPGVMDVTYALTIGK